MNLPAIADLVPHAGNMVLIDQVIAHDAQQIHCRAELADPGSHPLAQDGSLPATALAEYGAQAMAVHGGLLAPATPESSPRGGLLVALGRLDLHCDKLSDRCTLDIHAQRLAGSEEGYLYQFAVSADGRELASGQATVMFPSMEQKS